MLCRYVPPDAEMPNTVYTPDARHRLYSEQRAGWPHTDPGDLHARESSLVII